MEQQALSSFFLSSQQRAYLLERYGFSSQQLDLLLDDIAHFSAETAQSFVQRRHSEMREAGLRNEQVFTRLMAEIRARRFAAPKMTLRQLKRIVYG